MPKRRRTFKRRRRFKRRLYRRKANIARSLRAPIPDKAVAKLRYCDSISLNPSLGSVSNYVFVANGCYDPDFTGTGHQPIGFDQWMGLYNHFYVKGARITCEFSSYTSTSTAGAFVAVLHTNAGNSDTTTDVKLIRERANTVWKVGGPDTGRSVVKLTRKFSHRKFFRTPLLTDNYRGGISSNPPDGAYFYMSVYPVDPTQDLFQIPIQVTIDYIVEFRERKALGLS